MIRSRCLTGIAAFSFLVMVLILVTWPFSCTYDPNGAGWRLWGNLRFGAFGNSYSLFNQELPYSGSVIAVGDHPRKGPRYECKAFDGPGLYYRHFKFPSRDSSAIWDGDDWWTLSVSRAYPAGLAALMPAIWFLSKMGRRKPRQVPRV